MVTLVAAIGGFRSDLSITRKTDGNFWKSFHGCFLKSRINENGGDVITKKYHYTCKKLFMKPFIDEFLAKLHGQCKIENYG